MWKDVLLDFRKKLGEQEKALTVPEMQKGDSQYYITVGKKSSVTAMIKELDRKIEEKEEYYRNKVQTIDSMKTIFEEIDNYDYEKAKTELTEFSEGELIEAISFLEMCGKIAKSVLAEKHGDRT